MDCPRCGNFVDSTPVNGIWTCQAQLVSPVVSTGAGQSGSAKLATYERCGNTFSFADLVAHKERLESAARAHGEIEHDRAYEQWRFERQAHDRSVAASEQRWGSAELLRDKIQRKDQRTGKLGKTDPKYRWPLILLFSLVATACAAFWFLRSEDNLPSWIPQALIELPEQAPVGLGALALAGAVGLFIAHLRFASKARWSALAVLGLVCSAPLAYIAASRRFEQVSLPEWAPEAASDVQRELLLAAIALLLTMPALWLVSRLRWLQAASSQRRWNDKRKVLLERVGCGDRACETCMDGLEGHIW